MKKYFYLIMFLGLTQFFVQNTYAQKDSYKFNDEITKVIKVKLMEKLSVDENTADNYIKITKSFQSSLKNLSSKQRKIYKDIENNLNAPDIASKIEEITDIDIQIANLKKEYYTNLKAIFTPKQIAQSIILQRDLIKKVKSEVDKRKKKKRRD